MSDPLTPPLDLDGMRHAAAEDEQHGHHLQAGYLRAGADEIERLRESRGAERQRILSKIDETADWYAARGQHDHADALRQLIDELRETPDA